MGFCLTNNIPYNRREISDVVHVKNLPPSSFLVIDAKGKNITMEWQEPDSVTEEYAEFGSYNRLGDELEEAL